MWEKETEGITYEQVQRDAKEIQDACNPIAVANAMIRYMKFVSDKKGGFDAMRADPYLKCMAGKLASLFHIDHDWNIYDVLYTENGIERESYETGKVKTQWIK